MPSIRKRLSSDLQQPQASKASKWLGRLLVFALLLYSPWIYGMVTWDQQTLLIPWVSAIIVCTLTTAVVSRDFTYPRNPLLLCLLLLLALAVLQVIPLPSFVYQTLAPSAKFEQQVLSQAAEYLSVESTDGRLLEAAQSLAPSHRTLSIHPLQTRASLVGLAAAVSILICSSLLFNDKSSRFGLLAFMSALGTIMGVLGILQNISWNNWSLLEMPTDGYFATFVSRNSAPQFLAVGIGCTIALLIHRLNKRRSQDRYLQRYRANTPLGRLRNFYEDTFREIDPIFITLSVALVTQLAAVVGTASRGGVASMLFAILVTLLVTLVRNRNLVAPFLVLLALTAAISLLFIDSFELTDELSIRIEEEGIASPIRLDFWKLAISQRQFWLTGCGLGNFHFALLPANSTYECWIYHAESIFVELFTELGIMGAVLVAFGMAWLFFNLFLSQSIKGIATWAAAVYSVSAIGFHSAVDFSLIIPAIFLGICVLLGAYIREVSDPNPVDQPPKKEPYKKLILVSVAVSLLALLWQGYFPLMGFAQAEKLATDEDSVSFLDSSYERKETLDTSHSEVVLQLARNKVTAIENYLRSVTPWPEAIGEDQRGFHSQLEYATSVMRSKDLMRSPDGPIWEQLANIWRTDETLKSQIDLCRQSFAFCSQTASSHDWRSQWGIFQTTLEPQPYHQALVCARLKLLTNSMPQLQQSLGTCCLIAGERDIGLDFWKISLSNFKMHSSNLAPLLGSYISDADLKSILPQSRLAVVGIARALAKLSEFTTSQEVIRNLDLVGIEQEAKSFQDWNLLVWVAQQKGNDDLYIRALQQVADLAPMDKAVRVRLAKAHEAAGRIDEALRQLEQASRRTNLDVDEQTYLRELKLRSSPPNGSDDFDD